MYLIIDNYDSFVHNLAAYMVELGADVQLVRNDKLDMQRLEEIVENGTLEGLVLSPGPKSPADCGQCKNALRVAAGRVPVLGVCLGHQIIADTYGAQVRKGKRPMHGKVTPILTSGLGLFEEIPRSFNVTRYHSLAVLDKNLPAELRVDARADDGAIMAISHRQLPVFGVQFHPEAVLTEHGHDLFESFMRICRDWNEDGSRSKDGGWREDRGRTLDSVRSLAGMSAAVANGGARNAR